MSGRGDAEISEAGEEKTEPTAGPRESAGPDRPFGPEERDGLAEPDGPGESDDVDEPDDVEDPAQVARRARWTAALTGLLLALAGLAASVLRATGSAPALVPAAYALGAAVCVLAAFLGSRGRTRRALWLLVAGVMVMALGDQFD